MQSEKNIPAKLKGFTPLMDVLIREYGLVTAAVWGRMWRYAQQDSKVCIAANEKIAKELGLGRRTIIRHIKLLVDNGYLIDETPDVKHKPHIYSVTEKANVRVLVEGVSESHTYPVNGVSESHTSVEKRCARESHKESIKKDSSNNKKDNTVNLMLDLWKELFPDKPQPRATTQSIRDKIKIRMKAPHFAENWREAMTLASKSITCQTESWFDFRYFIRNDENYQKCLDCWMDWKDQQKRNGNGKFPPKEVAGKGWKSTDEDYTPSETDGDWICNNCWCTPCKCDGVQAVQGDEYETVRVYNHLNQRMEVYHFKIVEEVSE